MWLCLLALSVNLSYLSLHRRVWNEVADDAKGLKQGSRVGIWGLFRSEYVPPLPYRGIHGWLPNPFRTKKPWIGFPNENTNNKKTKGLSWFQSGARIWSIHSPQYVSLLFVQASANFGALVQLFRALTAKQRGTYSSPVANSCSPHKVPTPRRVLYERCPWGFKRRSQNQGASSTNGSILFWGI